MEKKQISYIIAALFIGLILGAFIYKNVSVKNITASIDSPQASSVQPNNTTQDVDGGLEIEITNPATWDADNKKAVHYEVKIKNTKNVAEVDWSVDLDLFEDAEIINSWNGEFSINNGKLTITPKDYNRKIEPFSETSAGFIFTSKEAFDIGFDGTPSINGIPTSKDPNPALSETPVLLTQPQDTPVVASSNGVSVHGQLKLNGTQLVDQNDKPVILKGMSSHGIAWFPEIYNPYSIAKTKEYGANVFRVAMYTEEYAGYTTSHENAASAKNLAYSIMDSSIALDMYTIIDWHILNDNNPQKHKESALAFFDEVSKKYADNPAVIYEICNEPHGVDWNTDIKPYAEEVIKVIRNNAPNAIIIVGTNTWSQDVDKAADNLIVADNIMYSLHFYSGTHLIENFKDRVDYALSKNAPVFVTEFGVTQASGDGGVYLESGQKWMDYLDSKGISRVNWSLADKNESSAALKPGANPTAWTYNDLTESGKFVFDSWKNKS